MKTVLTFLLLACVSPFSFGQELKVMSYNIRLDVASDGENAWPNRRAYFLDQIAYYGPDILGTQEVKPNQLSDMKARLTDYNAIGLGRDGEQKGEHSTIFFNTNQVKLEQQGTFWLSETPDVVSKGWDAALPRICTYGLFSHLESKEKFWVFNTHLDHKGVIARRQGMLLILAKISSIATDGNPVILMGDFNVEPDEPLISNLKTVLLDTKEVAPIAFGPDGTFNGFNYNEPVRRRIDYIFVSDSPELKVEKFAILTDAKELKFPSDHFPVFVQLYLE